MKILLIDDSKTMRSIQKMALASLAGAEFIEANNGQEALTAHSGQGTGAICVALVDWNMPVMDGITFVAKVREVDKKIPLIMVTTEAEKQRIVDAIKAGVNDYLIKPFTAEALLAKVQKQLAKAA